MSTWENETDQELRKRNRVTVEDYMSRSFEGRLTRHELFTEDGDAGLYTSDSGEPVVSRGREALRAHGRWSLSVLPDWVWTNVEIYETQNPNEFWVECDGEGKILFPGYPDGWYENHFLHHFRLRDGLIERNREFMNPVLQFRALGIDVPEIKREGIPAS